MTAVLSTGPIGILHTVNVLVLMGRAHSLDSDIVAMCAYKYDTCQRCAMSIKRRRMVLTVRLYHNTRHLGNMVPSRNWIVVASLLCWRQFGSGFTRTKRVIACWTCRAQTSPRTPLEAFTPSACDRDSINTPILKSTEKFRLPTRGSPS